MAKVNGREDALLNAYLNRYQTAQASNVSTGRSTTRKAQQQGSAIMNATDKTLPVLHNSYTETLNNIVQGANLENSLNNDILNRQMKLAQAKFDAANDLYKQQQKAQQYAAKKAAKAAKSGGKSTGKGGSTTGTGSDTESAASLDALFGGGVSTSGTTGSTAGSKPKAEDTKKDEAKNEKAKEKSAQEKYLEAKKTGARTTAAKSYAERRGTGLASAAQPAQSRAVTRGGKVIGSSYAAAGSAPSASETQAAKDKRNDYKSQREDIASALKKLQSDADYRAELAAPGRKLTSAEVAAVNQYEKSTKSTGFSGLKRVFETAANKEGLNQEDYAKKTAAMNAELNQNSALRGKAQMNGAGQTAQAFTAGMYDSIPFLTKSVDKLTDIANATGAELPQLSNAIEGAKSYDPLAATAGTLVGKGMQYNLFNTAMAGTPLAQTMGKAGNAVVGQAQKIPVLGDILGAGAGNALGRILTDTTADLALDTLPTLADDLSTYSAQQEAIANGQTVDDALTPGKIAGNTAKNIAGNVAMNALPEIGGALFNRLKGTAGDAAQDALKQADNAVQDVQSAAPARNIVQPEANGTTGLAAQIQRMNAPDAANRSALDTLDELRGQVNLNGAQEKEAEQLRRVVLQRQQEIGDEAKLALQNTDSLPIDAQGQAGYNGAKAGVVNENLGGNIPANVRVDAESGGGNELQSGSVRDGLSGQAGEGGQGGAESVLGRGVQSNDARNAQSVAEWAQTITGKDRRSPYTRRIESLYSQMQNGASREDLAEEAKSIALGIVRAEDYAEPLDESVTILKDYLKTTPIKVDAQTQGELLNASGLKTLSQYNIQNGTHFSLKDGVDYDTAITEVYDMMGMENRIPDGNAADALMGLVQQSKAGPLVDTDMRGTVIDYMRDRILDGPGNAPLGGEDFADWLDTQSFDRNAPDYVKRVYERGDAAMPTMNTAPSADAGGAAFLQPTDTASEPVPGLNVVENAQSVAKLNGSESVHPNTVGSKEREMPYQEYAGRGHSVTDIDRDTLTPENQNILGTNAPYTVQRVSHAEQQANAQQIRSNEGLSATIDRIVKDSTSGNFNDETETLAGNTLRELNEKLNTLEPNTTEYAKTATQARIVRSKMREGLTKTARTLESAKQFTTPEKAVMNIEGILSDARDAAQKKNPGAFKKAQTAIENAVEDGRNEANAQLGEIVTNELTKIVETGKQTAGADSRVFNEAVRHVQEELEFTFQKLSGESDASKAKVLDSLKNTITDYLGVDDSQAAEVVQNIEKMYNSALSDGAMKRLAQIFPDTNKTANAPRDQFLELLRSGAYNDEYMGEAVKDLAATKFGIQQLSDEQVANIKQLAEQMETLPKDSKARVDIENEIATIAAGNVKGSFWDKWNAMRYTGMLFNAVTNIKNAVNNVGQGTLALLKDGVNGAVQRVAKAMGNDTAEVTVGYLNPASKADRNLIGRAFADTDNSRWRQLTGASENFEIAKAARNAGQTFNTRVMRTIDQMSSAMLEDADVYGTSGLLSFAKPLSEKNPLRKAAEFAQDATKSMGENGFIGVAGLKNNYSRYLASYLKSHGATDAIFDATDDASKAMLEQARDYAVQQALVNTYHEANKLTEFIGKVKKSANDVPILGAWVEGQLPFVKTPTNVGIQAWRYSPGGLMQGLLQMGYDAAKGKDINKAMDTFSAGLTGSAIAGLGAYLWSTGHLVPGMTDEEKAEADLTGAQENSLQFTDENGKLHSYTINWLSNWAGPMMVGANLAKMWDTRNDTGTSVVDKVLNACVSVLDPVIDNSYLSSLNNTIDQLGNAQTGGEKAATLLTSGFGNYFTQAVPTLSGQLARTIDPTRRSTYTGLTGAAKNFAYFGQKSENKIPVLSKSNEPYIDVWGNEEKNFTPASGEDASDYAARAAYNFLSPGYYSESDGDEVSQYVEELYKSTGDKNVLPKNSSARGYTVSVPSLDGGDSTEQRLTPQEKTSYDKTYGQTAYDLVDELRQNSMFLQLPEDQQSALVQDAYTVAKTAGGVAAVGDGVSGVNAKEYEAYRDGGAEGFSQYVLMKNATDLVRDEKRETSGNDDATLNTVEKWNTLYSQFGDDAVSNFVNSTDKGSTVRNISDLAGDKAVTAYMQAYSAVAKTLDDDQTPDKFTVGYGMQKYGLSGDDFARAYLAAYYKKDKNGKYPEKGGTYADKAGAEIYQSYGADALRDWVNYRATIPDTNGNGKADKAEAVARLKEMDLTNEMRRAYLAKTNKQWGNKNPF